MTLIPRIISAIADDLPQTLDVDGGRLGQRTEIPVIPYRVVREAVVNAVMHRSYQAFEPIQVVRYANRIVIKNPGHSLKSQDRFDSPGSSLRNPTIAAIMHETRFAETKGSGIRVMQAKMRESGLTAPTFESDRDNDDFSAIFLFHHFLNEKDWEWLARFASLNLSEDQMKALIFVREVGAIDNSTFRSLTSADTLAASKHLRALREANLLIDRGSGVRTYYVAGPEMIARETAADRRTGEAAAIQDSDLVLDGSSQDKGLRFNDLPVAVRQLLAPLHLKQRLSIGEAARAIIALCTWRSLSAGEIAGFLKRNPVYTSQRFISPMVADGRLLYLYPEMPQHPEQRYVTAKTPAQAKRRRRIGA